VLPGQAYRTRQGVVTYVRRNGGILISKEKGKKLEEKSSQMPFYSPGISH
jgi:hypothetical protein